MRATHFNLVAVVYLVAPHCYIVHVIFLIYMLFIPNIPHWPPYNSSNVLRRYAGTLVIACCNNTTVNTRVNQTEHLNFFIFLPFWHIHDFHVETGSFSHHNDHRSSTQHTHRFDYAMSDAFDASLFQFDCIDSDEECVHVIILLVNFLENWKLSHFSPILFCFGSILLLFCIGICHFQSERIFGIAHSLNSPSEQILECVVSHFDVNTIVWPN